MPELASDLQGSPESLIGAMIRSEGGQDEIADYADSLCGELGKHDKPEWLSIWEIRNA